MLPDLIYLIPKYQSQCYLWVDKFHHAFGEKSLRDYETMWHFVLQSLP